MSRISTNIPIVIVQDKYGKRAVQFSHDALEQTAAANNLWCQTTRSTFLNLMASGLVEQSKTFANMFSLPGLCLFENEAIKITWPINSSRRDEKE